MNKEFLDDPQKYYLRENDLQHYRTPLKPGLKLDEDVKMLNPKCGKLILDLYGGTKITRRNFKRYFGAPCAILYPMSVVTIFANVL